MSDNGVQLVSREMQDFLYKYGIKHEKWLCSDLKPMA